MINTTYVFSVIVPLYGVTILVGLTPHLIFSIGNIVLDKSCQLRQSLVYLVTLDFQIVYRSFEVVLLEFVLVDGVRIDLW